MRGRCRWQPTGVSGMQVRCLEISGKGGPRVYSTVSAALSRILVMGATGVAVGVCRCVPQELPCSVIDEASTNIVLNLDVPALQRRVQSRSAPKRSAPTRLIAGEPGRDAPEHPPTRLVGRRNRTSAPCSTGNANRLAVFEVNATGASDAMLNVNATRASISSFTDYGSSRLVVRSAGAAGRRQRARCTQLDLSLIQLGKLVAVER
jgi:hypothetical protein